jgi:hypothetical protein
MFKMIETYKGGKGFREREREGVKPWPLFLCFECHILLTFCVQIDGMHVADLWDNMETWRYDLICSRWDCHHF